MDVPAVRRGSAYREAELSALRAVAHQQAAEFHRQRAANFRLAGRTEEQVGAVLAAMACWGWRCLPDRRWPGTQSGNIDLVAVGPGGVLVLDVKAWAEPRVVDGRLYRGQAPADDEVDKLLRIAAVVEDVTTKAELAPQFLFPLIVLAGRSDAAVQVGRVRVLGTDALPGWVGAQLRRVPDHRIEQLLATLAAALPPYDALAPPVVVAAVPEPVLPRSTQPAEQLSLIDVDQLAATLLAAELAKPIEEWMTFLHPNQAALVRRSWNGPARIRGPAGTGKTVTALHRAAYLTATRPGRVLVTGFVRTLPGVLGTLYRKIGPETADRAEFVGLHAWAGRFLDGRGIRSRVDSPRVEQAWRAAWRQVGAGSRLPRLVPDPGYWRQEIDHVIKARGLREFPAYTEVDRLGRKVPLQLQHKAAVWDLYVDYQQRLAAAALLDHNDVLALAVAEIERYPPEPGYAAVIVDEVTDLNLLGLRLVRLLAGDGPDSLLLIGDGRQAVYPGGARLHDAGIDVTGRAVVLRDNYRNTGEVLQAAALLAPTIDSADPDDHGDDTATVTRPGGREARWVTGNNLGTHDQALLDDLHDTAVRLGGYAGLAVLCHTLDHVASYLRLLADCRIPAVPLTDYAGNPVEAVKVGTYKRAKGLDFAAVFLPRLPPPIDLTRFSDPVITERAERLNRELHVAATRARDELWLGRLGW
jgi:hypothetical protein